MLRARHHPERLVLAAQSHLGRLLVELGEVDKASAFESLGLESLFVEDGGGPGLLIHAGAGGLGKRWPIEGFAEVAAEVVRRRDMAVALHEGPADIDAVAALAGRVDALMLKQPTLPRLAGALCHVAACLGNDSGVTHLAAAIGRPTVALFGADRVAWQPWARTARVVVVEPSRLREDVGAVTSTLDGLLG